MMKTLTVKLVVAIAIAAIASVHSTPPHSAPPLPPSAADADHIQFVVTWPPTFCRLYTSCDRVELSKRRGFYLHGLWPAGADGRTITDCVDQPPISVPGLKELFKRKDMEKTVHDLHKWWPSIKAPCPNEAFWRHEWNTHGVCCSRLNILTYLGKATQTFGRIDVLRAMIEKGVEPSEVNEYTKQQIVTAIQAKIGPGLEIYVSCVYLASSHHLHSIHMCLDLTASIFISCPQTTDSKGCGRSLQIQLLSTLPPPPPQPQLSPRTEL